MMAGIGRRGRAALSGAALAGLAAGLRLPLSLPEAHGFALMLLCLEAAVCGGAAAASTAGFFGRDGSEGLFRGLWGGVVAAAMGLALFAAGAGLWLKTPNGAAALGLTEFAAAFPPLALAAGLMLHGLELFVLRMAPPRDAEGL
jgi:hypothetical protein